MYKKLLISTLILIWLLTGWPVFWPNPRIPPKVGEVQAAALTAYLTSTANGGTLTSANNIATSNPGAETSKSTKVAKVTQYCELIAQGTNQTCSPAASIGSPTGRGFIYDVTTLEGQYFSASNWTGAMKLATSVASGITVTAYMRAYKRSSSGTYTAIASSASNSIALTNTAQTLTFNAGSGTATQFVTGDKLYIDFWVNITGNTANSSTATINLYENGAAEYMSTPGYNQVQTILGDGTPPSNVTIYPSGSATDLDVFTLATNIGTDTVTALTVTLSPAGAYNNIAQVDITDTSNNTKCTSVSGLSSNTVTFSTCTIAVTTSTTNYKVRITPKTYANMPNYGTSYATTGTVTSTTKTNPGSGSNTTSATVTVDNSYPNGATSTSGTAGIAKVTLNWTTSNSSTFATTNGSVILRWNGSEGSDVPADGTTNYSAGNTIGSATVACVISSAASTALSKVDGTGGSSGCNTNALTNGQSYSYKVFQAGTNGNYDQGVSIGSFTPAALPTVTTQSAGSITVNSAIANGNLTATGGVNADKEGFVYSTSSQSLPGNVAPASSGYSYSAENSGSFTTGTFTVNINSLSSGTTYYGRAYAHNTSGWSYGNEVTILTLPAAPTNVSASKGTYTDRVRITWTKSTGATDYHVWRNSTDLGAAGDVATYDDTGAAAGTITPGTASASDGNSTTQVALSISGQSTNNGTTYTYKVVASNSTGNSADSTTDTGYRGVGSLNYQWYRSSGDSDGSYSQLSGATGASFADDTAPSPSITAGSANAGKGINTSYIALGVNGQSANNGAGRYYYATLSATGASSQDTTHNRGYIGVGPLNYQWQRSASTSDANYSDINGASTASYNDTGAPADGSIRYYRANLSAAGATNQTTSSDYGYVAYISITITSNGTVNFNSLAFGEAKSTIQLGKTPVIKNNGNIAETFNISSSDATGGTNWTLGTNAGTNIFKHEFSPNNGDNWYIFPTDHTYANLATGVGVNNNQNLDLRITAPSSSDAVQKNVDITIQASQ